MKNFYNKINFFCIIIFFTLLTSVIPRYNFLTIYFIFLIVMSGLIKKELPDLYQGMPKIFYPLILIIFIDLLINNNFYKILNIIILSLSTLLFLKKIELEKIISIIKLIYYIFIIIFIKHLLANYYDNGYIINPIQYRDNGIIIALLYSVINFKNNNLMLSSFIHTITLFLAFITNSRFVIYISIFIYLNKNIKKSYLVLIYIIVASLLYYLLTNSEDFGSLIMRLKYGFYSPTRFNNDWVSGYENLENKIFNNNIIENNNPHNFFLDSSLKNGLLITLFILLLLITQIYKIFINKYNYKDVKIDILNLNIVIFIYGFFENSNLFLYFILLNINFFYISKLKNLNKNL